GEALSEAIDNAKQGDLIVAFYEDYDKLYKVILDKQNITPKKGLA
ncbi:cyanophycin synthetase, partial [Candidatus Arthromitus sp. SFB-2]